MTRPPSAYGPRPVRAVRAAAAITAARTAGYGPDTPLPQRDEQMEALVAAGCYYDEIAVLFDLAADTVARRVRARRPR